MKKLNVIIVTIYTPITLLLIGRIETKKWQEWSGVGCGAWRLTTQQGWGVEVQPRSPYASFCRSVSASSIIVNCFFLFLFFLYLSSLFIITFSKVFSHVASRLPCTKAPPTSLLATSSSPSRATPHYHPPLILLYYFILIHLFSFLEEYVYLWFRFLVK